MGSELSSGSRIDSGEMDHYILTGGTAILGQHPPYRSLNYLYDSSQITRTLRQVLDEISLPECLSTPCLVTCVFRQRTRAHSPPCRNVLVSYCTNRTRLDRFTNWTAIEIKLQQQRHVCITLPDSGVGEMKSVIIDVQKPHFSNWIVTMRHAFRFFTGIWVFILEIVHPLNLQFVFLSTLFIQ